MPTLTMLRAEERARPGAEWTNDGVDIEPGVDVAWAPSPNLTLNATLNPDFSQVETDQAQLDLNTSFALFFPEKRPFFLEGADYFTTPLQVLYTRQIADPDGGLRVTGRNGGQAYGAIVARDATTQLLVPGPLGSSFRFLEQSADDFVGRYRYDLDAYTSVGAIATYRAGEGYRNSVVGVDARYQKDEHTLIGQWLGSDSMYPDGLALRDTKPAGDALFLKYGFANRNWRFNAQHWDVDDGFRADLGFIAQVGYDKQLLGGGRTWFLPKGSTVSRIEFNGDWDITHRFDGQLLEREIEGYLAARASRQGYYELGGLTRVALLERADVRRAVGHVLLRSRAGLGDQGRQLLQGRRCARPARVAHGASVRRRTLRRARHRPRHQPQRELHAAAIGARRRHGVRRPRAGQPPELAVRSAPAPAPVGAGQRHRPRSGVVRRRPCCAIPATWPRRCCIRTSSTRAARCTPVIRKAASRTTKCARCSATRAACS